MSKKNGVALDPFEVIVDTKGGKRPVPCYARFGPVVVANLGVDARLYTLTHEESGLRCGPIFTDGILACEAARNIVTELGADYFVPYLPGDETHVKYKRVLALCQPFLDQESAPE